MRNKRKIDLDRSSNIPLKNRAFMNGICINDIAASLRGGAEVGTVPVMYSDDTLLNVPSIPLEDLPTDHSKANSKMQAILDDINVQLKNNKEEK